LFVASVLPEEEKRNERDKKEKKIK